jgi:hypothetical protein
VPGDVNLIRNACDASGYCVTADAGDHRRFSQADRRGMLQQPRTSASNHLSIKCITLFFASPNVCPQCTPPFRLSLRPCSMLSIWLLQRTLRCRPSQARHAQTFRAICTPPHTLLSSNSHHTLHVPSLAKRGCNRVPGHASEFAGGRAAFR